MSSSTCRQQAAFNRFVGVKIDGTPVATAQGVTISDCISLCFQNLNCKSINYDRTESTCYVYSVSQSKANVVTVGSYDFYEFNCGNILLNICLSLDILSCIKFLN